jgi:tetratricopeptide (TPR) repeat protein
LSAAAALAAGILLAAGGPQGPDACAPLDAGAPPDPAAAAAYRDVGDGERAAGSLDTAAAAYRAAAALDPGDARSREALAALCAQQRRERAFDRGLRLVRAGDRAGAVAAFEEARAAGPDPAAALLEGICLYELGEDDRARALLAEAGRERAHREAASFFLGLLALREGRGEAAAALLEASAADRGFGPAASDLARLARREGRVVLGLLAEVGWDSNLDLTPDGAGRGERDGFGGGTALVRVAPRGDTGPYLRAAGTLREQVRTGTYDLAAGSLAAGWQGGRGGRYLLGEAGWDYRSVGRDPYLSALRALGMARTALGGAASGGLTYVLRREAYLPAELTGFSGVRQAAEADVTVGLWRRAAVVLAWRGGYDAARDPVLTWWEQGPRVALRLPLGPDARLSLDLGLDWRRFTREDPALGARRLDRIAEGALVLERELSQRFTLRAAVAVERDVSSVPAYTYWRVIPTLGLAYTVGLL